MSKVKPTHGKGIAQTAITLQHVSMHFSHESDSSKNRIILVQQKFLHILEMFISIENISVGF